MPVSGVTVVKSSRQPPRKKIGEKMRMFFKKNRANSFCIADL
ncbi:hypothetical protein CSUNSWCD_83 [Campylobacter showae CSUNSWCD]|uniref:Uncharacterized protein n=1 Tax=Campylobacter showae CSUNSWCD TaxID=1244083 RepID=M5ISX0_9BACT|nr:hypothetical protein CSUNSWCD_83 [Campylobacter showae CSUNSWCD]